MKRILPLLLLPALALADGPRPISVTNVTRSGEEIATATLAFGAGRAGWTFDLVAMSGLADGGDDFDAWARTNFVATIGPNDTTYTWTAPAGFWDDASCLRFALVPKSGMPYDRCCEFVSITYKGYAIDTGVRMGSKEDAWRLETDSSFTDGDWMGGNYMLQLNTSLLPNRSTKSHVVIDYNSAGDYWLHAWQDGVQIGTPGVHNDGAERNWANQNVPSGISVWIWRLGKENGQTSGGCVGSLWTFRIWRNGTLVRDFLPVVAGGLPRLFDRVEGRIYSTSGFDAAPGNRGPDVPHPADSTSDLLQVVHGDAPIFGGVPVVSGVLGGSATVSGALTGFGGDPADCTLSVLVGTQPDLSDAVVAASGTPDGSGAFSIAVTGLDPDTTYYAAVGATGGAGGTARTDAVSFATLGAWTISSASLSTSQRTATFTLDAVQGAGDATFQLLVSSAQLEKASPVVRSSGGTVVIEWNADDDPDIAWDTSYEWRIRVSSEFGGGAWTNVYTWEELSGWSSYCTFWDTAAYAWTGRGETPAWSDTNNWELLPPATAGKGYPDYVKTWNGDSWASAVFTNGTVADVLLDGNRTAGPLRVQGSGTRVTVRGAPGTSLRIGTFDFGSQTGAELGSVFRLDGARAVFEYDVPIGNGNALVLDNGSSVTMTGRSRDSYALWLAAKETSFQDFCGRVEVRNGSVLTNETYDGIALGGNGLLLVSNATVLASWYLHPNAYTVGGRVRFEGPSARLVVPGVLRGWNGNFSGENYGVLEFCVPKGGWTNAPLQYVTDTRNGNAVPLGGSADTSVTYGGPQARPIRLRIAADSPALLFGKTDTALVSWAPGVNPDRVRLDAMPKPAKDSWLSATTEDGPYAWSEVSEWTASTPMPLAMGAHLVGTGGTFMVIR